MKNKITVAEWLIEQLNGTGCLTQKPEASSINGLKVLKILNQAKEMEKEELRKFFFMGWTTRERFDDLVPDMIYPEGLDYEEKQEYAFEQYYKEQYKK
jgi:hypothetical protein